jgi:flagellar protein FlaF
MQMYRSTYDDVLQDSGTDARQREYMALSRGVTLLHALRDEETAEASRSETLLYIRRLWTLFVEDLARPENGLPEELRASLISIGIWIIKEADRIRHTRVGDIDSLIAVNAAVRDALK